MYVLETKKNQTRQGEHQTEHRYADSKFNLPYKRQGGFQRRVKSIE